MFTGSPVAGDVVRVEWNGYSVEALAGQWIVSLEAPVTVRNRDGDIISTTRVRNWGNTPNSRIAPVMARLALEGIRFEEYGGSEHVFLVSAPASLTHAEITERLVVIPGFASVAPNGVGRAAAVPNDPLYSDQWGLDNTGQVYYEDEDVTLQGTAGADISAPEAWDLTKGSSSVVVAVMDTGINYNHNDLAANIWRNTRETDNNGLDDDSNGVIDDEPDGNHLDDDRNGQVDDARGFNFVGDGNNSPMDDNHHGTWVAGVIGARGDNSLGVAGVAWDVRMVPVKVLDSSGGYNWLDVFQGFEYVNALKESGANIRVVNCSFGVP